MLELLQKKNPTYHIYQVTDPEFDQYAKIITFADTDAALAALKATPMPKQDNEYVASDQTLEQLALSTTIQNKLFGGLPIQVGYCNGHTSKMNCLEWHQTPELNWFTNDVVLFFGDVREMSNNQYQTSDAKAFLIPANTMILLYGTTLHYAPCQTTAQGYRCLVALIKGVNSMLNDDVNQAQSTLLATDKWLIAHAESHEANEGAVVGLLGTNYEVKI